MTLTVKRVAQTVRHGTGVTIRPDGRSSNTHHNSLIKSSQITHSIATLRDASNDETDPDATQFKALDPKRQGTTAEDIALQISGMLHRGELTAGDRLPPERDLAKMLGVSRPTLRAGISFLAAVGVVRSRPGAGTFVVETDGVPSLDSGPLRMMATLHGYTSAEMFEARQLLEMAIAGLAAERATGNEMAAMAEEVAEMYASLDEPEQFFIHDNLFHQMVAAASGNRILTSLMNMVSTIPSDEHWQAAKHTKDLKQLAETQRLIYRSIRDRNSAAARDAMRGHLVLLQEHESEDFEVDC